MQIDNSVSINSNSVFNTIGSIGDIDELNSIFSDLYKSSYLDTTAEPSVKIELGSLNDGLRIESISTTYSFAPGVSCDSALSKIQNTLSINNTYESGSNVAISDNLNSHISSDTKFEVTIKPIKGENDGSKDNVNNNSSYNLAPSSVDYSNVKGDVFDTTKAKPSKNEVFKWIEKYSAKYGVDSALMKAVVQAESNFNNQCISRSGAVGLMQLMPVTAKEMGLRVDSQVDERWDPEKNIEAGIRYIAKYHKIISNHFGEENWDLTLAGYNAGPNRVIREGGIPNITETKNYVKKINGYINQYR